MSLCFLTWVFGFMKWVFDGFLFCGQELEFNWRIVLASVIGFLGSAFGTVGGVGGGGIFVPMLTLIVGFDTKSAAALSKCKFFFPYTFFIRFVYFDLLLARRKISVYFDSEML